MSNQSLEAARMALKQANDQLAKSVARLKTIPPKPPLCNQCGKVRRPFAPNGLCEGCSK